MPQPAASPEHLAEKELVRRLNASNTARQFGFVLAAAEPGRAVVRMRVAERHKQVHGVVHGGVLAALADTAGGLATYMSVPRGSRVATVEMKMNYLEPVEKGTVVADARMIRVGKTLAVVECDLRDETERLVGKALMTFSIGPVERRNKPRR
jgi:uncharacterized protein (TIGR00369 family)